MAWQREPLAAALAVIEKLAGVGRHTERTVLPQSERVNQAQCSTLYHFSYGRAVVRLDHNRQVTQAGKSLAQEFHPFTRKIGRLH